MDFSKITQKIYKASASGKEATVLGVKYTFKLPSMEQQKILDNIFTGASKMEPGSEDRLIASADIRSRSIAYGLESIDGEIIPDVVNGVDRDKALTEEIRKWPDMVTNALYRVTLDMKVESAVRLSEKMEYDWFGNKDFDMAPSEETVEELTRPEPDQGPVDEVQPS